MTTSRDEQLEAAVATLGHLIDVTRDRGLHDTAQFLAMARLHLLMDVHGITEEEFRALCRAAESEAEGVRCMPPRPADRRAIRTDARNPDGKHQRKAWTRSGSRRSRVKQ